MNVVNMLSIYFLIWGSDKRYRGKVLQKYDPYRIGQRFTVRLPGLGLFKAVSEQFNVLLEVPGDFSGQAVRVITSVILVAISRSPPVR